MFCCSQINRSSTTMSTCKTGGNCATLQVAGHVCKLVVLLYGLCCAMLEFHLYHWFAMSLLRKA